MQSSRIPLTSGPHWRAALAVGALLLAGCGEPTGREATRLPAADAAPDAAPAGATVPEQRVAMLWSGSCALCHVDGTGGAPRLGSADDWQPRLAKGRDMLLQHTLEGFNNMPPLGYCMSCEREDFEALIRFMAGAG